MHINEAIAQANEAQVVSAERQTLLDTAAQDCQYYPKPQDNCTARHPELGRCIPCWARHTLDNL